MLRVLLCCLIQCCLSADAPKGPSARKSKSGECFPFLAQTSGPIFSVCIACLVHVSTVTVPDNRCLFCRTSVFLVFVCCRCGGFFSRYDTEQNSVPRGQDASFNTLQRMIVIVMVT